MELHVQEERKKKDIPLKDKYLLTLRESTVYFNINEKRIRRLLEDYPGELGLFNGNKTLVNRGKMEAFLDSTSAI